MVLGRGVVLSLMQCPPDSGINIAGPASRCFFLSFSYAVSLAPVSTTGLHRLAKNNVQFFYSTAVGNVTVAYKWEAFMKV